ncbi:M15 family metallopeptidase [Mesorhizobium sp. M0139]|uniref:M15 family metallopeptidase n=1 Tax=Mesorhizobium sp. M0139 TaxID=2956892 RepID=UPI0033383940
MATIDLSKFAVGGATRPDSFSGLDPAFLQSLQSMIESAPPEIQQNLRLMSGYRSVERQQQLFDASDKSGHMVARPGHSQHNFGHAVDFKFLDPAARQYAHDNAAKYGLNFPMSWEPWHVEPIGARKGGAPAPVVLPDGPKGQEVAPPPLTAGKPINDYPVAGPPAAMPSIDVAGQGAPAPESGLSRIFAALAPMAGSMAGGGVPQGGPAQSFGSGDPMGATIAAAQAADRAKGLAAGLAPNIDLLMGLGKRPALT